MLPFFTLLSMFLFVVSSVFFSFVVVVVVVDVDDIITICSSGGVGHFKAAFSVSLI